jgi:hypothetical protein
LTTETPPWRGTGRTTRQIKEAPERAIYVWPVRNSMGYARDLAHRLGRDDLHFVSLETYLRVALGFSVPVVIDHATWEHASHEQWDRLERFLASANRCTH